MSETTIRTGSQVSREQVEIILKKFLDNNNGNYRVLALKGAWGVGKTHLVQNILAKYEKEFHYYASVFGISSIEQLKSRILANYKNDLKTNHQDSQIRAEGIMNYVKKPIANLFEWFNGNSGRIERTPRLDLALPGQTSIQVAGSLISVAGDLGLNLLFNGVKNSIICIDDLERKSNLSLDEILGFVEYLVQEMKCRLIIIYNEKTLDCTSKKALNQYREKVIDIEVELNPTVEENLDFIFKDNPDIEVIKSVFKKAETNNIRVLRKTKWFIDELIPFMSNWEPSLREQIIKNIIVISLSKLDTKFPVTIDKIKNLENSLSTDNVTYEELIQIYSKFGYNKLEINEQLIQVVETSLFSEQDFIQKGNNLNKTEKHNQIIKKFDKIFEPYSSSFGASEKEISERMIKFLEQYHLDLPIDKFKSLENLALAVEVDIYHYQKLSLKNLISREEPNLLELKNLREIVIINYPELADELEKRIAEIDGEQDITTVLCKIIENKYWSSSEDIQLLNNCTVDEYSKWLQEDHPDLYTMVRWCLNINNVASQRLTEAIVKLGRKSDLNKMRAKFLYNINIEDYPDIKDTNDES
ncbi:KAP family P-loop domain protein [Cylindrospermum stagnale PCC 7417]|uniref:KAP family P-loop domain protein n=1 Tax=Cylindrospermum stagnale PCC 7417 TaxID=56107 RepID=K9X628_9NOST|nr:KAP family P-loop domain protein [Cylindrospermum stagnale]AFZ27541.1 KAP family P-loop domain protein [Cylindrospermum stagnale PCC 7417]